MKLNEEEQMDIWEIKKVDEDEDAVVAAALAEGWEPFAVVQEEQERADDYGRVEDRWKQNVIWLRKRQEVRDLLDPRA